MLGIDNCIAWPDYIERDGFTFKAITPNDFDLLHRWLNTPHVASEWDNNTTREDIQEKFGAKIISTIQRAFIVYHNSEPLGYIQAYQASKVGDGWWPGLSSDIVGFDQFIGVPEKLGKGLGSGFVKALSDWLLELRHVSKCITDPSPSNLRAIRAYEKAGFIRVGLVQTPDGEALLMEKLGR